MTREETIKALMTIQAAYPNYKPPDKTVTVNTWHMMLEEYTYEQVISAIKAYISTDNTGFAPCIGQIIDKIQVITTPQELNEMEAWALVSKALRNGYYGAQEEFDKLPPNVQKAVGSPDNLRNWSQTDSGSVENVIQSNFMRSYRTIVARQAEVAKMPQDIKQLVDKVNESIPRINSSQSAALPDKPDYSECVPMPDRLRDKLNDIMSRC